MKKKYNTPSVTYITPSNHLAANLLVGSDTSGYTEDNPLVVDVREESNFSGSGNSIWDNEW